MKQNLAQKLIQAHLIEGRMKAGEEIGVKVDQTLCQDATGTLVMLELEAMGLERVKTECSVQYVDHNILQEDSKNQEDHLFLYSAARRFGLWFSPPGEGVSHPVHQERFGRPGKTLIGSDSHTCAAGCLGMLAIGAGGLEVAMAMAGHPFYFKMPRVWGIHLRNRLPQWVSAKDLILELLRRHSVKGGVGRILEYYGDGLDCLSAMDRHVIANMGAELGATASVFPADQEIRRYLRGQNREADFQEMLPDEGAEYDLYEEVDLSRLEPLAARPSSPDRVVPVRTLAGLPIVQATIGSSANPGYRDFAVPAAMVRSNKVAPGVSFDVNPTSRQILENLIKDGHLASLVHAGGRIHQAGCNGCIGMGQAPAQGGISLRTVPRNFPGRSGTLDDRVYLVSPETATASALKGEITDPRELHLEYPAIEEPAQPVVNTSNLVAPLPPQEAAKVGLVKGKNIAALPPFEALPDEIEVEVLLKVGDNLSTDEILPAGSRVLPYRSNIPRISEFAFIDVDPTYNTRARQLRDAGLFHAVVGGQNYGQGSSREHAALAPRYLGLRLVLAAGFARIHWQNLINFGVLPLAIDPADSAELAPGEKLKVRGLRTILQTGKVIPLERAPGKKALTARHDLSGRQIEIMLAGGLINWVKAKEGPKETHEVLATRPDTLPS